MISWAISAIVRFEVPGGGDGGGQLKELRGTPSRGGIRVLIIIFSQSSSLL
jgi:hypothetical protein